MVQRKCTLVFLLKPPCLFFKGETMKSLYEGGNFSERVKSLLKKSKHFEIRIGPHVTQKRMLQRQIKIEDIWKNLQNPERLYYAKKRKTPRKNEESFKCYFDMSGRQCHIYGIVFNRKYKFIKIATVIKDRIKLQRKFKYAKK